MPLRVAQDVLQFMFRHTPSDEKIEVGYFGGEPLLEFDLIEKITDEIERNPQFSSERVKLSLVTNGTLFSKRIARFIQAHDFVMCLSCDGPPRVQDLSRRFPDGSGSSAIVLANIRKYLDTGCYVLVNAVYGPETLAFLPETIRFFSSLGLRQIYINPDYSASWAVPDVDRVVKVYSKVGELYSEFQLSGDPHFISLIDSKIALILRGGYKLQERCRMGRGEFGFAPSGNVYPCERLIGGDNGLDHCIGTIKAIARSEGLKDVPLAGNANVECQKCGLADYCMNWCGCSNYFSSGNYYKAGPFLCASEKASIIVAYEVFARLQDQLGPRFADHAAGLTHSFLISRTLV